MKMRLRQVLFGLLVSVAMGMLPCTVRAADWWSMTDADFVAQYKNLALGTQTQQSQFAWMLFGRLNQPANLGDKTYTVWELWPSNPDTFSPNSRAFVPANKFRTRPHLQAPKAFLMGGTAAHALTQPSFNAGEEVTRNTISYNYITDPKRPLNTKAGIVAAINAKSPIDLPVAAIETKGNWITDDVQPGMYQINDGATTYALNGLHIMVKIVPDPKDPQSSPDPSWFWTTFEYSGNPQRAGALRFINGTNRDSLPAAQLTQLLTQAGLNKSPWTNYACNGVQISFLNAQGQPIVLGNTTMEADFAIKATDPSTKWTQWVSSCHTCHAEASAKPKGKSNFAFPFSSGFNPEVGKITGIPAGYTPLDFNMSILFEAR
jgi:hypothetical protein